MTNSISEILDNELIFVIGSNTTENHPVIGSMMNRAVKNGAKLIVVDPRKVDLTKHALHLQIKPGTNVALLNGMMHYIYKNNLFDSNFIYERTEGFSEMISCIEDFDTKKAAEICGIDEALIIKAAELYASTDKSAIYYAMGITQHSSGTDHVKAVANLAMMCGHVGKYATGVNPLRGQNNVQGACDMGALPNVYPGYQKIDDPFAVKKFEKAWGVPLSRIKGLTIPKMIEGALNGSVKMLYVMGENPLVSDPDLNHVKKAIAKLDFLVVQDIFLTETAKLADIVLPAACFAEKEGTFTNTERRIQRVNPAVEKPGEAKEDWMIFQLLMEKLGYKSTFESAKEIMDEIASLTPIYGGISYHRLTDGLQWPCVDEDDKGTQYLHRNQFKKGIGTFHPVVYLSPDEVCDETYPFVLTTGRILYQYHTRTMTGKTKGISETAGEAYIEISAEGASELGICHLDKVRVSSRRGEIVLKACISDRVKNNVVFIPFHFSEAAANILTNSALDPETDIPEYKVCAVKVEKL